MVLPGVTDGMIWYIFEVCQVLAVVAYTTPILFFALLPVGESTIIRSDANLISTLL